MENLFFYFENLRYKEIELETFEPKTNEIQRREENQECEYGKWIQNPKL